VFIDQPSGHLGGLDLLIGCRYHLQPRAIRPGRTQSQTPPDQGIGRLQHLRGRAVVGFKLQSDGSGMLAGEVRQVAGLGAGERVDRLVDVTDHADVCPIPDPQFEQRALDRTDVLVFVDGEVAVLVAHLGGHLRVFVQQGDGAQQNVVEVDQLTALLHLLVAGQRRGDLFVIEPTDLTTGARCQLGIAVRRDIRHLGPADLRSQITQQWCVDRYPQPAGGLCDQREGAAGHLGKFDPVHQRPEVPDLTQRGGVESAGLHLWHAEVCQPVPQFAGRLGGEGDSQRPPRIEDTREGAVGDAVGYGASLPSASAGEHHHRDAEAGGHRPLLGVQAHQHLGGSRLIGSHDDTS